MAQIFNAHVRNVNNENMQIIVFDSFSGAIVEEKTLDYPPNKKGLRQARAWLKKKYKFYEYTSEGFNDLDVPNPGPSGLAVAGNNPMDAEDRANEAAEQEMRDSVDTGARRVKLKPGKIVTRPDGTIVQEGATTTYVSEPRSREVSPTDDLVLKTETVQSPFSDDLPEFDNDIVGVSGEQINSATQEYEQTLRSNFLMGASSTGNLPVSQQGPVISEECVIKREQEISENVDQIVKVRKSEYYLGDKNNTEFPPNMCEPDFANEGPPYYAPPRDEDEKRLDIRSPENYRLRQNYSVDEFGQPLPDPNPRPAPVPSAAKHVQQSGLSPGQRDNQRRLTPSDKAKLNGIAGNHITEPVPEFNKLPTEKVISGKYNTWIVFGRDRPGQADTGFGGKGATQCGAIDIVVGRMSPNPKGRDQKEKPVYADPLFRTAYNPHDVTGTRPIPACDAARIYLSQKTYVDQNFGLAIGRAGYNHESERNPRSAIAMKADAIRIMSREGIKLVTSADGKYNSMGGMGQVAQRGVDIIAGNQTVGPDFDLQPMVKGKNLVICLKNQLDLISKLNGQVQDLVTAMMLLEKAVAQHTHVTAPGYPLTAPSITAITTAVALITKHASVNTFNSAALKWKEFKIATESLKDGSDTYILSKFNNVN